MNEITVWIQGNWYELGTLLSQLVFLAAGIWFARRILRTLRASQEQVGALLKLSVTGTISERQPLNASVERPSAGASPYWLTPEAGSAGQLGPLDNGHGRLSAASHGLIAWLNTPMKSGGTDPVRKAIRWLQSPSGS